MAHSNRSGGETDESDTESRAGPRQATDGGTPVATGSSSAVKEWTVFVGALLTTAGFGSGVFQVLVDTVDTSISDTTGNVTVWGLSSTTTMAVIVAAFLGVMFAQRLAIQQEATKIAFVSTAAGTFGLIVMRVGSGGYVSESSLAVEGLFVNAIIAGLVAGSVAAAGVLIARNLAPTDSDLEASDSAGLSGQVSD